MKPHKCEYKFNEHCAAQVCTIFDPDTDEGCHKHKGLTRCWCGWSETDPGRGYQELAEMGENMEGLVHPSEVTVTSDEYFVTGITRRYT